MKKIFALLCISTLLFTSCVNDDEVDFDTIGQTYEIENVNFGAPNYATRFIFPQNIFNSDVVLVYRLESVTDGFDVWEPLPTATIYFTDGGYLQYRFNFTSGDVDILLESDDPALLGPEFTNGQVFRIVVVPSAFAESADFDANNINSVMSSLHIEESDFSKIKLD